MPDDKAELLTVEELSRRPRLSTATIHRLKNTGRIPFYQPGGKGGRILFPPNAIERGGGDTAGDATPPRPDQPRDDDQRLAGPLPTWMRKSNQSTK